ncbi:TraB/GumN family protein [Rhizobium sp. TH2]|uniref:TraB/GumN family protein n=1 Tax=Rhizobium sp. TH2 TaxID=2775403 RepID=UPI00215735CF|nr:TraB/GumN family protein [Rhizobium sp. TH2]UVC08386.1 TraB/GumN family protein [Rhizobium sp. TH2]
MSTAVPEIRNRSGRILDLAADSVLSLIVAVHIFAALLLAVTLLFATPAGAAEDAACGARNLVAELETKNPAEYAKLKAEGDKVKNAGARFWKLEMTGHKPNWLLGTIHLSDPRVTDLPHESKSAYDGAATVVLESDEVLDQQKAAASLMAKPDLMYFSGTDTLDNYLKPDQKAVLEANLIKRGIPFLSIVKMKPYLVTSMVSLSTCELSRKANGAPFLDMKLAKDGAAAGKKIKGVETMQEQIEAMASLPLDFHVRSLVSSLKYPEYTADMMETTVQLYLSDRIGMVFPAGAYFAPETNVSDFQDMAKFEDVLITRRNHNMADRAMPILAEGNVFMAVGALHLIGDEGLVELFRQKGYTVTAVR